MLTIALCKGKLIEPTLKLFAKAGYGAAQPAADSRRLLFPCPEIGMTFLIVRPTDVPTYVEHGAADVGVVGKDVLLEQDCDVYEPLDLGFGACRIAVAAFRGQVPRDRLSSKIRVATKYPKITERYFNQRGVPVEIIKLKAHGLIEVECIARSTARLIVNRASLKLKHQAVAELLSKLRHACATPGPARKDGSVKPARSATGKPKRMRT